MKSELRKCRYPARKILPSARAACARPRPPHVNTALRCVILANVRLHRHIHSNNNRGDARTNSSSPMNHRRGGAPVLRCVSGAARRCEDGRVPVRSENLRRPTAKIMKINRSTSAGDCPGTVSVSAACRALEPPAIRSFQIELLTRRAPCSSPVRIGNSYIPFSSLC
ncbi:hypothetical protein EVAR_93374_1 [Eumeta japonica]|uniref:Uncharacterized protein n=1 Tax=Eumeta variegata TaxID=151549 RepID=A0A4C2AB91_EUMVA|nr:hypothetical protein EVAR_93374_1 [Eumeta japonica]